MNRTSCASCTGIQWRVPHRRCLLSTFVLGAQEPVTGLWLEDAEEMAGGLKFGLETKFVLYLPRTLGRVELALVSLAEPDSEVV